MKSSHAVLLMAGAGFAAGLAYKMTQLPPIPISEPARQAAGAPATPDVSAGKPSPIPGKARMAPPVNAPVTALASAPETVYTEPPKPVERKSQPVPAAAPARKNEATSAAATGRKNEATAAKPARKNKPVAVASTKVSTTRPASTKLASVKPAIKPPSIKPPSIKASNIKPKQWIPGKYESQEDSPVVAKNHAPQVLAKPAPAAVVPASINKSAADKSAAAPVVPAIETEPAPAPPAAPHQATLQTGMTIAIRLDEPLSISFSRAGATFAGELVDPLIAGGFVIAERGAHVAGRVLELQRAGRFTGTSRLVLELTNVYTSDGQQVSITTERWTRLGDNIPAETVVRFRLTSTVTITERQLASK